MDTRRKIVRDACCWRAPDGALAVKGPFDPLLAAHAAQLGRLRAGAAALVVWITDPPDPILPAEARAELVAALRWVDAVILDPRACPEDAIDLTADHTLWREQFLARVLECARRSRQADAE
ncbi:MAG: hypothetical protein ACP5UT_14530 [Bryobacteraceae bacterium]